MRSHGAWLAVIVACGGACGGGTEPGPPDAPPPVARVAPTLAIGSSHRCALRTDGTVACAGDNSRGQLGTGTTAAQTGAVTVAGLTDVVALAGSQGDHTCALRRDRTIACWGDDFDGQVGDGATADAVPTATTVALGPVVQISAGPRNTCALIDDGTVWCWGEDGSGQLGDGSTAEPFRPSKSTPQPVAGLDRAALAVGLGGSQDYYHTCVELDDATVRCFGNNVFGQIGAAAPFQIINAAAVAVPGLGPVDTVIPGGNNRTCTITAGTVSCWGHDQADPPVPDPRPIAGITTAAQVALSMVQVCIRLDTGVVECWVGGGVVGISPTPIGIDDATELAAGSTETCARRASGEIWCWTWETPPVRADL